MPPPFDIVPNLLRGLVVTIELTIGSVAVAIIVSMIAGLGRVSRFSLIRIVTGLYVEIFRGTSILVQLFWLFYVLPFFGIMLPALLTGILGLGLNGGAYGSEIVRGAIVAVPRGQTEAAIALNMTRAQRMLRIILPQAVPMMLPPLGNLSIELFKLTAIASLITLNELTFHAYNLMMVVGRHTEIFTILLLVYFAVGYPITLVFRKIERSIRLP
jgi:polar amino acid transport system permease protein